MVNLCLKEKYDNFCINMHTKLLMGCQRVAGKLKEEDGADGTPERGLLILGAIACGGFLLYFLIKKLMPDFFENLNSWISDIFGFLSPSNWNIG